MLAEKLWTALPYTTSALEYQTIGTDCRGLIEFVTAATFENLLNISISIKTSPSVLLNYKNYQR